MPSLRFVLITASLLVTFICINDQSVFVNCLSGQLPSVSALLAIGCVQKPLSLVSHASSASLQLLHRYTSVLVAVAILGLHAAEASLQVVNEANFKDTGYYGSPVSLTGQNDILITFDDRAKYASVTWKFNSSSFWEIQLDKCDNGYPIAGIEISDSCKWKFVWYEEMEFRLSVGKEYTWKFPMTNPPTNIRKLRAQITNNPPNPPMMGICVMINGDCQPIIPPGIPPPQLKEPEYCMLSTGVFNVNMTNNQPRCPTSVTIMGAQLLYDFYEPTTMPSTTQNGTTSLPLWTGPGPAPSGYATRSLTPSGGETSPGFPTWGIVVIAIVGGLVLIAVAGGLIAFFCTRGNRGQQVRYGDDANVKDEGLIEWENVMAHAPYKPTFDVPCKDWWLFIKGDKLDLSTVTAYEYLPEQYKELLFEEPIKGTEDYGVVEGRFDYEEKRHKTEDEKQKDRERRATIYHSSSSVRIKAFVDRLSRLTELDRRLTDPEGEDRSQGSHVQHVRVPELRYFWISQSPNPLMVSYIIVRRHFDSVANWVKPTMNQYGPPTECPIYKRVGYVYTTFAALASIHRLGCVHRDVSPAAFVLRGHEAGDCQYCLITHLSLSRIQYNIVSSTWLPRRRHVNYFGTHKYASRAAHAQQERSFKDDVESWFFTAVELIWPTTMPWDFFNAEIGRTNREELHKKYMAAKDTFLRTFTQNNLIVTFPAAQFRMLANEIVKMKFETMESDYRITFFELLYDMVEQLPMQVGTMTQNDVLEYIRRLNADGCYDSRKFKCQG